MKKEITYNKLIRDKIPEITKAKGIESVTRVLNNKEYILELRKKILEEAKELNEESGNKNLVEELADIQEIIDAILVAKNIKTSEFRKIQTTKRQKRGGFKKKLFLIKTVENK
jgi:predicted house-cleaning noncanonical NTP pyrophosphatase (MazG superfamily)